MKSMEIRVGCAGWTIPKLHKDHFPDKGTHLERYASRFSAVEINSSFYREHKPATYERWAASVPEHFKFAVKVPKQLTHESRLCDLSAFSRFISEVSTLGEKLGPLLVQLPPKLAFNVKTVKTFFTGLCENFPGNVVCEPRHASWFTSDAERLLTEFQVARVAADPAPVPGADQPGGWNGLVYFRLHGSPRMYYSEYSVEHLDALARLLIETERSVPVWCIFDNTAAGAATINALTLLEKLKSN